MNSDLEALLASTEYSGQGAEVVNSFTGALPLLTAADVAVEIKALVDTSVSARADAPKGSVPPSSSGESNAAGMAETVARTVGTITGVGPLVTGLFKLFGSHEVEAVPPLEKFTAPESVFVEAALTRDREYAGVRYAQGGSPESLRPAPTAAAQAPTIQVNIQAMDSQSFLDRQEDIARAVREAMLHSNSINDLVLEL